MNIVKENGKIILELTEEENQTIDYFLASRGPNILNEYFNHFMAGRSKTREHEEKKELVNLIDQLPKEKYDRIVGEIRDGS